MSNLEPSQVNATSIRRVELTNKFLRIYLKFSDRFEDANLRKFRVITYVEASEKTRIYEGRIPQISGLFSLNQAEVDQEVGQAAFEGSVKGGEVNVPIKLLCPFDRLFIQIEADDEQFDESDWLQKDLKQENVKSDIHEKTMGLIPCYNAEKFIKQVVLETLDNVSYLIVVNDGSTDRSGLILEELCLQYPDRMEMVRLPENKGKGFALLEGFKRAIDHPNLSILVTLDADAQHRPTDILYLAKAIEDGCDLAIGSRLFRLMPMRSKFSNGLISFLLRRFYANSPKDTQSGMRGFSKKFLEEIIKNIKGGGYEYEFRILLLALEGKRKIHSLPITTLYIEKNRSSHFSPIKDSFKIIGVFVHHLLKRLVQILGFNKK